ncbi:MAG: ribosomal-protein-alanine N-acetyltransferase [Chloroflexota bacterium]|nr:MAG: ribosomal-protein-alanine N-acetyltransferase [Chloroflexota bacterium]
MRRAVSQLLRPFGVGDQPRSTLPSILGFAGLWLMFDEAHITTIGVRRTVRGLGLGELLLVNLVESARELGANRLTLEVRVSNHVAQSLYRKYTFKEEGVRKRYYSDNGEDALIMWSDRIDAPAFVDTFRVLRTELDRKIAALSAPIVESRV